MMKILVTGGAGFIGSNFIRYWFDRYPKAKITCLDAMTYAARPKYLYEYTLNNEVDFRLVEFDITYFECIEIIEDFPNISCFDAIFHFAAESHVCNSIQNPTPFFESNIVGTYSILEMLRRIKFKGRFIHISTDEVFGVAAPGTRFREHTQIKPTSPYASTKAASDLLVLAYHHTYGLDTVVTNCSNNFGPNQHYEKLIPRTIQSILQKKPMTVYGTGKHVRDWIYVEDHCEALETVFYKGKAGERYCIGGDNERTNLEVIQEIAMIIGRDPEITYTNDRPSDDARYAIDCTKLKELDWAPRHDFHNRLKHTVNHYLEDTTAMLS